MPFPFSVQTRMTEIDKGIVTITLCIRRKGKNEDEDKTCKVKKHQILKGFEEEVGGR